MNATSANTVAEEKPPLPSTPASVRIQPVAVVPMSPRFMSAMTYRPFSCA